MDTRRGYQIDHFVPQKLRPDLRADYDNLLYLCAACNNLKGATLLPDPCATALADCLRFHDNGSVEPISANSDVGERLIEVTYDKAEMTAGQVLALLQDQGFTVADVSTREGTRALTGLVD